MKSAIFGSKAIKVINDLKDKGLIKDYVIGGAVAAIYYVEPFFTYDLDIIYDIEENGLAVLSPIYDYLRKKGYKIDKEHIIIDETPVQFVPIYNDLIQEAFENAKSITIEKNKTKIIKVEYLAAIFLQVYRPKDREKLLKILEQADIDKKLLAEILKKYKLEKKLKEFKDRYNE